MINKCYTKNKRIPNTLLHLDIHIAIVNFFASVVTGDKKPHWAKAHDATVVTGIYDIQNGGERSDRPSHAALACATRNAVTRGCN